MTEYIRKETKIVFDTETGKGETILCEELAHIELMPCGHQNNLKLAGNKKGRCPKCLKTFQEKVLIEPK